MAKKFGKFLLFTAAIGSAAVAAYYYLQKKDTENIVPEDDDYDDFSEDLDETSDGSHNYVPLTPESKNPEDTCEKEEFTPLTKTISQAADKVEETVEEFFDEEDSSDKEPPISDN